MKAEVSKLESVLTKLHAAEWRIEISSFWGTGWWFKLGKPVKGFKFETLDGYYTLDELADAIEKAAGLNVPEEKEEK